jgi:ABC-type nickel/cobalt efflux system permease component RcnA
MRRLVLALALVAALWPAAAEAHPLGNFTVNRHSAIDVSGDRLFVHYVLDLAEIPTFQEGKRLRARGFARQAARRLELVIDGQRALLRPLDSRVQLRPGAGGLKTLRFEAVYEADRNGTRLTYRDGNFAGRLGWREVVVRASRGAAVESSSVPAVSRSVALTSYPNDLLSDPLSISSATATFRPGPLPGLPPELGRGPARERAGGFEALIADGGLRGWALLLAFGLAAFWGAAHALTPGHGKAIVASYLVGTRGRPRDAVALGLIVTVTHTIGVFALGFVTLLLSAWILPERLYPWLTLVSGLLVVGVGASVLGRRLRHRRQHAHGHHHHHHNHEQGYGRGGLLGVGVAAGILPCPSALVVLLSAIALHRVGLGLALIVAFSIGLAATITAIGLVAVLARRAFSRLRLDGRLIGALPSASALAIVAVGIGITLNALPEVL